MSATPLRIVRDEPPVTAERAAETVIDALPPIQEQLESLQGEISTLQQEVNALRRRDETLNFYMRRMDEEMRLAARLQQDFLPKSLPQLGSVRFHTIFRPAGYVSGDLYDVMRLDETHVGFYMADAVGHGMPAALLTMFIKNALVTKEITAAGYRLIQPCKAIDRLNHALLEQNLENATFATAIYGHVNTQTLQATFSRGGHPCPILLRNGGMVDLPTSDGSLLGIFADGEFSDCTIQLQPGDRLFVYTDGVEVAFGDESNGHTRWNEELLKRATLDTASLLADLCAHIDSETGSLNPKDDLTLIVIDVS